MLLTASVTLKAPGPCRAWLEDRPPWEAVVDKRAKDYWRLYKELAEEEARGLVKPCLVWEAPPATARLPENVHEEVFHLAEAVLAGEYASLVDFWGKFGPLANRSTNAILVGELENALGFYWLMYTLWDAARRGNEARLRGLLLRPFEEGCIDAELAEWARQAEVLAFLNEGDTPPPYYYHLYVEGKTSVLLSKFGHLGDDAGLYFLKVTGPPEGNLAAFARKTVVDNLKRYLGAVKNYTKLDPLKGKVEITPSDVFTAALFSLFVRTDKAVQVPAQVMRDRRKAGKDIAAQVLDKYRKRLKAKRKRITPEQLQAIKAYRDKLLGSGKEWKREELQSMIDAYARKVLGGD